MYAKNVLATGALLSLAAAVPMANKRELVWETSVEVVIETVQATTTVWVDGSAPTPVNAVHSHYGHGHGGHRHHTTTVLSTSTVPYSPPETSTPESSSVAAATPESSYVAPTSTYVPPPPATTEAPVPTTQAPAPTTYAAPTTSAAPAPSSSASSGSGSGGSPSGKVYEGDITYYTPGMGSCGWTSSEGEAIVALSHEIMEPLDGANPNTNPLCGKMITISYDGGEHTAKVVDTCPGCDYGSIDLTNALFTAVAPSGDGRVSGVKWWFNN